MKKILVVDDDLNNLRLLNDIFSVNNYEVITLSKPENCIDTIKTHCPDLVLMDIQMPILDGFILMQMIRETKEIHETSVIALTASSMKGDKEKILAKGFDGYVTKPFQINELLEYIQTFL